MRFPNLAQAVQVTAYQAQQTLRGRALDAHASRFEGEAPASVEAIEGLSANTLKRQ